MKLSQFPILRSLHTLLRCKSAAIKLAEDTSVIGLKERATGEAVEGKSQPLSDHDNKLSKLQGVNRVPTSTHGPSVKAVDSITFPAINKNTQPQMTPTASRGRSRRGRVPAFICVNSYPGRPDWLYFTSHRKNIWMAGCRRSDLHQQHQQRSSLLPS